MLGPTSSFATHDFVAKLDVGLSIKKNTYQYYYLEVGWTVDRE